MFKTIVSTVLLIFVLVACNAAPEDSANNQEVDIIAEAATEMPTDEAVMEEPTLEASDAPVMEEATLEPTTIPATAVPTIEPTAMPETTAYNAPDWTNLALTNARTGETFTLADFAGKTVFVEPMATWCPNCRTQQGHVSQAMTSLNSDDFVFISLSVGENVSDATLADYATRNNFPQIFAVATNELTSALVEQFGFSVSAPPSTPHFTISPIGTVSGLSTGQHQSNSIVEEVTNAQNS